MKALITSIALVGLPMVGLVCCSDSEFSSDNRSSQKKPASQNPGDQGDANPQGGPGNQTPTNGTQGQQNLSNPQGSVVNCEKEGIEKPEETFNTPLVRPHKAGNMGRKSLDGTADKGSLTKFVNDLCLKNYKKDSPTGSTNWDSPLIGSGRSTRDAICKLYGYSQALDETTFGYYELNSPDNDWSGFYDEGTKQMKVHFPASASPTSNKILVWTACKGKVVEQCQQKANASLKCNK